MAKHPALDEALPPAWKFRWPILVTLDASGDEDAMLDLKMGVAHRLNLVQGSEPASVLLTDRQDFLARFVQALTDLNAAGMIEADEQGLLLITETGRRASEIDVGELPEADADASDLEVETPPGAPPKATAKDYFFAFLESWL